MRYRFIEVEKAMYPVTMLCRVLRVSRSGFYAWQQHPISPRAEETRRLDIEIKKLFEASKRRSGSPKITRALVDGAGRWARIASHGACACWVCGRLCAAVSR